jgi:hypothetical protein
MNISLNSKEMIALLWAIELTEGSFAGWSKEEIGSDSVADLSALKVVYGRIDSLLEERG